MQTKKPIEEKIKELLQKGEITEETLSELSDGKGED